jgi:hypothetical protein
MEAAVEQEVKIGDSVEENIQGQHSEGKFRATQGV